MFNAYFKNDTPATLAIALQAKAEFTHWQADMMDLILSWGFTDCRSHAFEAPTVFMSACNDSLDKCGPKMPGFTGGKREQIGDHEFFSYTLSGSKVNVGKRQQLENLAARHRKPELDAHWPYAAVDHLICCRLNVMVKAHEDVSTYVSTCWILDSAEGKTIVVSVPMVEDDKGIYQLPPHMPEWEEITNTAFADLLNQHNREAAKKGA